ncbi:MAG TPA: hypothetical protein VG937_02140, partial [Polyangiaceae bacterium]|nr:hypothetical protein [Polyangiaceae bacterium]
ATLAPKGRSSAKHGFLVRGTHVLSTADVLWMAYPQRYRARPRRSPQKDPFGKLHKTIDYPGVPITTRPSRKTTQVVDGNWGIHAIVKKALFAAGG